MKSFLTQIPMICLAIFFVLPNLVVAQETEKVVVWSKIEDGHRVELIREQNHEYILRTPLELLQEQSQTELALYEPNKNNIIPEIQTDELIQARLTNMQGDLSLQFNHAVRVEIDRYLKHRGHIEHTLGRASYFLPIAKQVAIEKQVPHVLTYLPLIESNYKPKSKSRVGAKGLWQFMPSTAKIYGLKVNRSVDERLNPELATAAAFDYLIDLHEKFGDWQLALAAYNAGPGRVQRSIRQSGLENPTFWDIQHLLPSETQRYIIKFIAAVYVMEYSNQIGLQPSIDGYNEAKEHVEQLSNTKFASVSTVNGEIPANTVRLTYDIKTGDNLGFIAEWYDVKASQLRAWNGINGNMIRAGQSLDIYVPEHKKHVYENINALTFDEKQNHDSQTQENPQLLAANLNDKTYIIRKGDTLWAISRRSGVSVDQIKRLNNISNSKNLKPGMVIKLGEKS